MENIFSDFIISQFDLYVKGNGTALRPRASAQGCSYFFFLIPKHFLSIGAKKPGERTRTIFIKASLIHTRINTLIRARLIICICRAKALPRVSVQPPRRMPENIPAEERIKIFPRRSRPPIFLSAFLILCGTSARSPYVFSLNYMRVSVKVCTEISLIYGTYNISSER